MVDFAGTDLPVQFTSIVQEHQAVRTSVGWFDVSHMGRFLFNGPQSGAWLERVVSCRVANLPVGKVRYGLVCQEDGGVLDDVLVYNLGGNPADWGLVVNASNRARIKNWLMEHGQGLDAKLTDETDKTAMVAVQGPKAMALASGLFPDDPNLLPNYGCMTTTLKGHKVLVSRTGYTGEDGFEVILPADQGIPLIEQLVSQGVTPCGLGARDTLRLEAGMPLYGHELSEKIDPFQAGLGRSVDLDKAFIGREALAQRKDRKDLPVRVGIVGSGKRAAREKDAVVGLEAQELGIVTSGTVSPTRGEPVAMAYLKPDLAVPGTPVQVLVRGRAEPFVVTRLPFYKRAAR